MATKNEIKNAIENDVDEQGYCFFVLKEEANGSQQLVIDAATELGFVYTVENENKIRIFRNIEGKIKYQNIAK